jgi:hypothetical protein
MNGVLPDTVLRRPKTPLAGLPYVLLLQQADTRWVDHFEDTAAIRTYVNFGKIPPIWSNTEPIETWVNLRPLSLNLWLKNA